MFLEEEVLATMRISARSHGTEGLKSLPSRKAEKQLVDKRRDGIVGHHIQSLEGALVSGEAEQSKVKAR